MPRSLHSHGLLYAGCLLGLVAFGAATVYAQELGLKAGLWEFQLTKQVVDGHDRSAQLAASVTKAEQALASLPPAQRQQLQALMANSGLAQGAANGSFRVCISPQMAKRDALILDKDGRCHPVELSRSAGHVSFRFSCTANGVQTTGTGEATLSDNLVAAHTELTTHAADGTTHAMTNETQMRYISSDCGALKPAQ